MPSWEAIWCRSLRRLRSRVLSSVILYSPPGLRMREMLLILPALCSSNLETLQPGFGLEYVDGIQDRKSTRLNSSHANISYAVFCLKKKNTCIHSVVTSTDGACLFACR